MGTISVHEFVTLDGVVDEPSWTRDYPFDPRMGGAIAAIMGGCRAILLGRTTYEMFEPAWSVRTVEDDPGAPFFNDTTKYVVSGTLTEPTWRNSQVVGGYDPERIRALKDEVGDLYVSGSVQLVRAMLADGLVDHLHLLVYPLTRGEGVQLFVPGDAPRTFAVADRRLFENGVTYLDLAAARTSGAWDRPAAAPWAVTGLAAASGRPAW